MYVKNRIMTPRQPKSSGKSRFKNSMEGCYVEPPTGEPRVHEHEINIASGTRLLSNSASESPQNIQPQFVLNANLQPSPSAPTSLPSVTTNGV